MSESNKPAAGAPEAAAPPTRDPMYRAVVGLLIADVIFGLGLAVFGAAVLDTRPIAFMGLAVALVGLAILAFYIAIGSRADRRAKVAAADPAKPD